MSQLETTKLVSDILAGNVETISVLGTVYRIGKVLGDNNRIILSVIANYGQSSDAIFVKEQYMISFLQGALHILPNELYFCNVGTFNGYVCINKSKPIDIMPSKTERMDTCNFINNRDSFMYKFNNGKIDNVVVKGIEYRVAKIKKEYIKENTSPYRIVYKETYKDDDITCVQFISLRDTPQFLEAFDVDKGFVKSNAVIDKYVEPVQVIPIEEIINTIDTNITVDKPAYVPFTSTDDISKYLGIGLKLKKGGYCLITAINYDNTFITTTYGNTTLYYTFCNYTFLDGTPFGKKV